MKIGWKTVTQAREAFFLLEEFESSGESCFLLRPEEARHWRSTRTGPLSSLGKPRPSWIPLQAVRLDFILERLQLDLADETFFLRPGESFELFLPAQGLFTPTRIGEREGRTVWGSLHFQLRQRGPELRPYELDCVYGGELLE